METVVDVDDVEIEVDVLVEVDVVVEVVVVDAKFAVSVTALLIVIKSELLVPE